MQELDLTPVQGGRTVQCKLTGVPHYQSDGHVVPDSATDEARLGSGHIVVVISLVLSCDTREIECANL